MESLSTSQKKHLRGLAHRLKPIVRVGANGVTDALIEELKRALDSHELIKVKFIEHKEQRKELTKEISTLSNSVLVGELGNTSIFYRQHPDKEKRSITLS